VLPLRGCPALRRAGKHERQSIPAFRFVGSPARRTWIGSSCADDGLDPATIYSEAVPAFEIICDR
jgi:hypothetical protein